MPTRMHDSRTCAIFDIFWGKLLKSNSLCSVVSLPKLEKALPKARSISLAPSFLPQQMPDTVFTTCQGADIGCHGQAAPSVYIKSCCEITT